MKDRKDIFSKLDYSNISAYKVTDRDCEALILGARVYGINTVVISPASIKSCLGHVIDTVKTAVSIAYPSGALSVESKVEEIDEILKLYPGIGEFYVVMNMGLFLEGNFDYSNEELKLIMKAACGKTVKFVVESGILTKEQTQKLCDMAAANNVPYIVASTGFLPYDTKMPTLEQITRLVECAGGRVKIVACGDINTLEQACQYLAAGADRVFIDQRVKLAGNTY